MDKKQDLHVVVGGKGSGRTKEPYDLRKRRSDYPHHNRVSEKDVSMAENLHLDPLPSKPPVPLSRYEKECWNFIASTQQGQKNSRWIYRNDSVFVVAACMLYGRLREIHKEINQMKRETKSYIDPETGKPNPLLTIEANINTKFQDAIKNLGLVPSKRMVVVGPDKEKEEGDRLLA